MPAVQPQQSVPSNNQMGIQANFDIQKITETVEQFAGRIIETERIFRKELEEKMEQKLLVEVQHRQNLIEEAYKQERLRYHEEIQHLKVLCVFCGSASMLTMLSSVVASQGIARRATGIPTTKGSN